MRHPAHPPTHRDGRRGGAVLILGLAAALTWGAGATSAGSGGNPGSSVSRTWTIEPNGDDRGSLQLRLDRRQGENNRWTESFPVAPSELVGLDAGARGPVAFELRRDAGTIRFEGEMAGRRGRGTFDVVPDRDYLQAMSRLGYSLDDDEAYGAVVHDVGRGFVRELRELGYRSLAWDDLVAFRIHGATPEFIRTMNEIQGAKLSPDQIVNLRIHGATPEFAREMAALGYDGMDADELVNLRIHGATAGYARDLRSLGIKATADELVNLRIHGATTDYIRDLRSLGIKATADELVNLRIHGATPEYVRELRALGYQDLTADELVNMRIHGVSPSFVRRMRERGYRNLSPDRLVDMRIHGYDRD